MIVFKEKSYSEYENMRLLYTELKKSGLLRPGLYETIGRSQLPAVLKGNNIVIERFAITTSIFGKDKYRMYIKVGAKAKMPDEVRLDGYYRPERLGRISFKLQKGFSNNRGGNNRNNNGNNNNNNGGSNQGRFEYNADLQIEVRRLIGEAIKYDKSSRELILEFDSVYDAIKALNILPFGINYKVYLLE